MEDGKRVLASSNLYVIELDEKKASPFYVKAYLESSKGMAALKRVTSGYTMPTLEIDQLRKVRIPLPSLAEQNAFADKYRKAAADVERLQSELDSALRKMGSMFDSKEEA